MNPKHSKPIAILGAGAWGTALALLLARCGQIVRLWSIEAPQVKAMLSEQMNRQYLPGFLFPETIKPTGNLNEAIADVDDILIAVPSVGFRETLTRLKPMLCRNHRFLCATKGMDIEKGQLLHATLRDILGPQPAYGVLSGPSFAKEVAAGLPTAVVIASQDEQFALDMFTRLNQPLFRIDISKDIKGVEIGGIVKNVIAIAAGINDGMKLGANARSTLITRGLNEMINLGIAIGADYKTFEGLAGLGDLILTCTDDLSRNRRFGLALGKGITTDQAEKEIGQVVEGKHNAELVVRLARQYSVKIPICEAVHQILQREISTAEGVKHFFG